MSESVNDDFLEPGRKTITTRINREVHKSAKIRCAEMDITFPDLLEYALKEYLGEKPELIPQEEVVKIFDK